MSTLALKLIEEAKYTRASFLDLGHCGFTELPDNLSELTWLKRLNLGGYYFDANKQIWQKSSNSCHSNNLSAKLNGLAQLPQLRSLDLRSTGITDIGVLAQLPQLQSLDLGYNRGITDIGVLAQLPQLQSLHLNSTGITDIGVLARLPQLQSLDLSGTDITDIGVLARLPQLQSLDLSGTDITDIGVLAQLPQLQSLDLGYNRGITDIGVLARLPQLQSLNLSGTDITDIGVLAQLPQLQSLNLIGTDITDIGVLAQLPQLQSLNLNSTGITDIGVLAQLPQLQSLDLSGTDITDIGVLAQLPQLQSLNLNSTGITDIGVLAQLPQLQSLDLGYNKGITDIGVLARLPQLQSLHLNSTDITDIGVLARLPQLQSLNLSGTGITDIGVLARLPQLQSLNLSGTGITDIGVLARLPQLQSLHLSGTDITDIGVLARLPQLQSLNLSGTDITDIGVLAQLPQLQSLDLGYNRGITDIGVLARLPQLQSLHLNSTGITDIGVLARLLQLRELNIAKTSVRDISPLLSLIHANVEIKWSDGLFEDEGIYVENCPLDNPPVEIVKQGNPAILNFFRQIDEQGGTVPLYEAKLIMVGEPGAGKTSLTEKLLDENHEVQVDDPKKKSTLGINVRENWQFPDCLRPKEYFTSHIWDFGGQEIQYMTHQFFLTPESLYVLVADDRKQHTLFPYWFEVIQLLGKDDTGNNSPILVVLNERNHKSITNFDLNEYRLKYPNTRIDMLEVDLADCDLSRFRTVRDKIQQSLCSLSHVGRQLPRKWPEIRKAILDVNDTKNHINEQEFAQICARFNVIQTEDRQLISKYLHQLGVILHFQNDRQLRDFIIINPSWALKAVYAVLENKEVERKHGRFTETDLDRYWEDLTDEERIKILSLMKRDSFEICYPVGNQTYIALSYYPKYALVLTGIVTRA